MTDHSAKSGRGTDGRAVAPGRDEHQALVSRLATVLLVASACIAAVHSSPAGAETADEEIEEIYAASEAVADSGPASERIIIPVPISNPQLGTGLGIGVAWFYSPNGSKVPWTTGVGGMKTSNGSWAIGAIHKMSLAGDRFRIEAIGGRGRIESKYYGSGTEAETDPFDMVQEADYIRLLAAARVSRRLFAGARLKFVDQTIALTESADGNPSVDPESLGGKTKILTVGPTLIFDSTNGGFARDKGVLINADWLFSDSRTEDNFAYSKANLTANEYFRISARSVLVLRQSLCTASQDAPFFDLCLFGSNSNLRGYESGEHRDSASWSAQAEWRHKLGGKFGMVAFAGVGSVAHSVSALPSARFLPSAGVGVRYLVAKENGVNLRLDYAWGRESNGVYVSIGEAF